MKQEYKWKEYAKSIQIPKKIGLYLLKKQKEHRECMKHALYSPGISLWIRPYRRGKNRCHRCGLKKK